MLQCIAVRCCVLQCVVAMCCNVLQCVAVCCGVLQCIRAVRRCPACTCAVCVVEESIWCYLLLQCVAVRCSALQCVAVRCIVLQCVTVCCSVLQCVAVCCSVLQFTRAIRRCPACSCAVCVIEESICCRLPQHAATHYSTLQHTTACRITLQHNATYCSIPQHAATRYPVMRIGYAEGNVLVTISQNSIRALYMPKEPCRYAKRALQVCQKSPSAYVTRTTHACVVCVWMEVGRVLCRRRFTHTRNTCTVCVVRITYATGLFWHTCRALLA